MANKVKAGNKEEAGNVLIVPVSGKFRLGKPYGIDVFKAIATLVPVNFAPLFVMPDTTDEVKRGTQLRQAEQSIASIRGSLNPLARLLNDSSLGRVRGAETVEDIEVEEWGTAVVTVDTRANGSG